MRAVKVVYRSNFDSDRAFQREFAGMAAFEPISRGHRGFVHVLHVGRGPDGGFFYYIMELGDDMAAGRRIDPADYRPRTLRSDLEANGRLPAAECVRLGISLAETLAELHGHGLTHRDVKPANIIFVNGEPKLADIGLVALSGQRSFVGTEGYVPAEGFQTPQADLYALGKVLYEISMGRDRMDFPALPDDLDQRPDKDVLLRLNAVLLKACAVDPRRRHANAEALRDELAEIGVPRARRSLRWVLLAPAAVLAAAALLLWLRATPLPKPGGIVVSVNPADATILLGEKLRRSPAEFAEIEPGAYKLHVMRSGFVPVDEVVRIESGRTTKLPDITLRRSLGALRIESQPAGATVTIHGPLKPIGDEAQVQREGKTPFEISELPTGEYRIVASLPGASAEQLVEVTSGEPIVVPIRFTAGSLKLASSPGGASVLHNGVEIGRTPMLVENLTPGTAEFRFRLEGYREAVVRESVRAAEQALVAVRLERNRIIEPGKAFSNSLGMPFLPMDGIWIAATETRVADYRAFLAGTAAAKWKEPGFATGPADPVVNVSWNDAGDFCRWLTETERASGRIDAELEYRLPTDAEWSRAAQLDGETGETPEQRDGKVKDRFPWGGGWPPPAGAGNYGHASKDPDGFTTLAPVGSFPANALGLYDLGGNVWEWCADSYNASSRDWGVLRGGSWATRARAEMLTSYRNVIDRNERDVLYGFRCVLAPARPE